MSINNKLSTQLLFSLLTSTLLCATGIHVKNSSYHQSTISVLTQKKRTIIVVKSASGIGSVTLNPNNEQWPQALYIHLYVTHLEGLTLTTLTQSYVLEDLSIKYFKKDAYFAITIPQKMLQTNNNEIKVHWVNFYR